MPDDAEDDTEAEADEPVVELGDHPPVDGAPLARIASRLTWPQEQSEIDRKEGDSIIRTPDGSRSLSEILDEVDTTYFATRQEFTDAIRDTIGTGPIPTE